MQCDHRNEESIRDLQEVQSRDAGTQGAHLPQEAKMAVPEVQEGPNAGAQAALASTRSSSLVIARAQLDSPAGLHRDRLVWVTW